MANIFISYSSKDREFALHLADDLRSAGHEIWMDVSKITGREPYWDEIQEGIESCSHFLFVVSPDSIERQSGARKELYHAANLEKVPLIVPVMARPVPLRSLPMLISPGEYQIHNFTTQPYDAALAQVERALAGEKLSIPAMESRHEGAPPAKGKVRWFRLPRIRISISVAITFLSVILVGSLAFLLPQRLAAPGLPTKAI